MPDLSIFSLPRDVSVTALAARLGAGRESVVAGPLRGARERLDSFDWRLLRAGLVLEYETAAGIAPRLRLTDAAGHSGSAGFRAPQRPAFPADLASAVLRRRLAPLLEMRMLLVRCRLPGSLHEIQVRDRRGKAVARVEVWRPSRRGECTARVLALRGFEVEAERVARRLGKLDGACELERDPLWAATDDGRGAVGEAPGWSVDGLSPDMRMDDALQCALRHYAQVMARNRPGLLDGRDSEFLHDFRVGLRRSRTLLRRVPGVFPERRLAPFLDDLAWLSAVTGPPRDADVHCLVFPDYAAGMKGGDPAALEPLIRHVAQTRVAAHDALVAAIESPRFRRRWLAWQRFLGQPMPRAGRQPVGPRPLTETAGPAVAAALRRVRRKGRRITAAAAPEAYHDLRKSGKDLRYLLDVFGEFLDPDSTAALLRQLKKLQDLLGEHQDLDVHRAALLAIHGELVAAGELTGETHTAMEHLVQELARRSAAVRSRFPARFARFVDACPKKKAFAAGRPR